MFNTNCKIFILHLTLWLFNILVFEFCRDFMSSMPTKESADLDGSIVYKLSDSQNRYSFTYM